MLFFIIICIYGRMACVDEVENNMGFQVKDWNAEYYEDNSSFQYNVAMSAISKIQCEGNEYIFDIGCGNGKITKQLAKKVPFGIVQGIDISENMIEHAHNHYALPNLFFDVADIVNFTSHIQYDFVVAFSSLAWIKDQDQVLRAIEKILKSGGKFVATMDNEDDPYLRARYAMFTHDTWKHFFNNYEVPYYSFNEDKIKNLLQRAGFVNIMIQKIMMSSLWVTRESFIGMLSAIPVQKDMIPQERHKEFFNDIVDEYIKEIPLDSDGNIELIFTEFIVIAEKVV